MRTLRPVSAPPPVRTPSRSATWNHPQSIWVCETAELLSGFGAPPGEASRRLLWAAAGLPQGRPCRPGGRAGHRERERAHTCNAEALAMLREACAAASRELDDEPRAAPDVVAQRETAVTLLEDADTALREALDLVS